MTVDCDVLPHRAGLLRDEVQEMEKRNLASKLAPGMVCAMSRVSACDLAIAPTHSTRTVIGARAQRRCVQPSISRPNGNWRVSDANTIEERQ